MTHYNTLRCNNCMTEFKDDYDLETCIYDPKTGESHDGCPICLTDEFMMDISEQHNANPPIQSGENN